MKNSIIPKFIFKNLAAGIKWSQNTTLIFWRYPTPLSMLTDILSKMLLWQINKLTWKVTLEQRWTNTLNRIIQILY